MKKLFVLLLILTLAIFVFSGCQGLVPSEGEGEDEGEEEVVTQGVTVDIEGAAKIENKTYVSGGSHEITVTFPSPVEGWVKGNITSCSGDYRQPLPSENLEVIFYPNEDRTVWTGSGSFGSSFRSIERRKDDSPCCASYLQITSGECEDEVCINMPVIVDSEPPYATIELCMDDCICGGCELSFTSTVTSSVCEDDTVDCGDDCSGLAGWSITLYDKYPFDDCCDTPCEEPVDTYSGSSCPIQWTTDCLTEESYYVVVSLIDNAGNEVIFGTQVEFDQERCAPIVLTEMDPNNCLDDPYNSRFTVCEEDSPVYLTMAVDPVAEGTATDETNTGPYLKGDEVSILATPATGYEFVNWTATSGTLAKATSADTTLTMPAEDVTVTANFELIDYTVSLSVDPTNSGIVSEGGTYHMGDDVTVTAIPEDGYTFVNWTDDSDTVVSTNATYNFTMPAADVNYTANFVPAYELTMAVDPVAGGTASDDTDTSPYAAGTTVSISVAETNTGYKFVNWTTPGGTYDANFADQNDYETTFTMPAEDVTVTANFIVVLFEEDFTGIAPGNIPSGWTRTHTNWRVSDTNSASGDSPEMRFYWSPSSIDTFRLTSAAFDSSGYSEPILRFKHYINHWGNSYTLKIQVTKNDGLTWENIHSWSPTGNIGPEIFQTAIDLGTYNGNIQIAWVLEGDSYNINYWYIDDIVVMEGN